MMKNNPSHKYSEISSFEDIRREKELLRLKGRITETKLTLTYVEVKRAFSFSNIVVSAAREVLIPKISEFLGTVIKKESAGTSPGPEEKKVKKPTKKNKKPGKRSAT